MCKQLINQDEEVILDDTECQTQRPLSERICRRGNCPAMWVAEDWTEVTYAMQTHFVNPETFVRILFSGIALKYIFATLKIATRA